MRLRFFGGFAIDAPDGEIVVRGRGQEALLFRLALDTGATVRYRGLAEDVWPDDPPEDPRAALQSLVSRLRRALPAGVIEAAAGGYRLTLPRDAVDLTSFQDLVSAARKAASPTEAADLARSALALWTGDPWIPSDAFDWVVSDLFADRGHAERLAGPTSPSPSLDGAALSPATPTALITGPTSAEGSVPAALTRLVGRRDELDLISEQLTASRMVTLIGPGGAGKTTLALETARRRPGAIVVELAPAAPDEVWPALAAAVGRTFRLNEGTTQPVGSRERAIEALAGRSLLLVLDNCEHVIAQAADVALDLLRGVPGASLLATSREPLGVPGEAFVDLGPLPELDAIELFSRRVRAARGRAPEPAEAAAVARIVGRLDGLPLALELAAAKARTLTIAEIDVGLDDRFALLTSGPRAADPRHQTLRALIDWSWETLTDPERAALCAAAVFPDGIGAADTAVVARHTDTEAAAFERLVDRSLLHRADGRFRMLETVREYGLDRLRSEGRIDDLRIRQAQAMVDLANPREALLRGPQVREGLGWFDANEENLSAAVRAAQANERQELGVRLVRAGLWAWIMRERFEDLQVGMSTFSSFSAPLDSEAAVVVHGVGVLVAGFTATRPRPTSDAAASGPAPRPDTSGTQPDPFTVPDVDVEQLAARAHAISDAAAGHPSEATAVIAPMVRAVADGLATARPGGPWSQSFQLDDEAGQGAPLWSRAFLALIRSGVAQNNGDAEVLGEQSERALALFREVGDVWGVASASQMRSEWLILQGRLEEALAVADAATEGLMGLSSLADVLQQRTIGVTALTRLGRIDEARARVADILAVAAADGAERTLLLAHLAAAGLEIAVGDGQAALQHLDAVPYEESPNAFAQFVAWSGSMRARALLLCGRPDDARDVLRSTLPIAASSGDQPIMAEAALTLAVLLEAAGDEKTARRALATSVSLRGGLDATDPTVARLVGVLGAPDTPEGDEDLSALVALLD